MIYERNSYAIERFASLTKETLSAAILFAAIFFNPVLAFVNAHVATLSPLHVSLTEAAITGLAISVVALNIRANMLPWIFLLGLLLFLHLALALANQAVYPKLIRDVIDIPIFIALGIVYARGNIVRLFFYIQCAVLLGLVVELVFEEFFANLFDIISYYVQTRDFSLLDFWKEGSTLFVSATRPGDRFLLAFLDIHRFSSIFLEPVSLGNFSILATIFTLSFWRDLSRLMKMFFVTTTVIILVGSDGRLAAVTCSVLALGFIIVPLLPRYSNVFYLPGALLLSGIIVTWFGLQPIGDDFSGRLAGSIDFLSGLDFTTLLGLHDEPRGFDSGISYFLITQSVFGLAAVWLFVCLVPRYHTRRSTVFIHSICIYISCNLLVSYSLFSIKTAALMWFMYGHLLPEFGWYRPSLQKTDRELSQHHKQQVLGV